MKAKFYKRFFAFIIDSLFVLLLSSIIIGFIPMSKTAQRKQEEYTKYYEKLIKSDQVKINEKDLDKLINIQYDYEKETIIYTIITIVLNIIYFVIFQLYNDGSTLGKKIMKIKLESNNDKGLNTNRILFRSMIINSIGSNIILMLIMMFFSKKLYFDFAGIIQLIDIALLLISIFMVIIRKDGRGLHDIVGNTKVVEKS